jgi:hypothetical protein
MRVLGCFKTKQPIMLVLKIITSSALKIQELIVVLNCRRMRRFDLPRRYPMNRLLLLLLLLYVAARPNRWQHCLPNASQRRHSVVAR